MTIMSISIQAKTDYSSLFNSLSKTNSSADLSNLISDSKAIKNGSYGKLVKAYYTKKASESSSTDSKTDKTSEEKKTDSVVTIGGKEIDTSEIDLSKSKVPDKSKSTYNMDAGYNTGTSVGDLFDGLV